jgi:hypothetical protein
MDDYLIKQFRQNTNSTKQPINIPNDTKQDMVYQNNKKLIDAADRYYQTLDTNNILDDNVNDTVIIPKKQTVNQISIITKIKNWFIFQARLAKVAWSIIIVLAGLLGYQTTIIPIENKDTISATIENRLKTIEELVKTDEYIPEDVKQTILNTQINLSQFKTDVTNTLKSSLTNVQTELNKLQDITEILHNIEIKQTTFQDSIEKQISILENKKQSSNTVIIPKKDNIEIIKDKKLSYPYTIELPKLP